MNKFYFIILILLTGIFVAIFFISNKDSIMKGVFLQNPTPIFPPKSDIINLISRPTEPVQENMQYQNQPLIQPDLPTPEPENTKKATFSAEIATNKGRIIVTLFNDKAPRTVNNFMSKARSGYYNKLTFHRVEDWVIQGGDPNGDGSGGGTIETEINSIPFTAGSLGVARGDDIKVSNDSQFFITKTDAPWLNEKYTNFGVVTEGMEFLPDFEIGDIITAIIIE